MVKSGFYTASYGIEPGRITFTSRCFDTEGEAADWKDFVEEEDQHKPKNRRRTHIIVHVLPDTPKAV